MVKPRRAALCAFVCAVTVCLGLLTLRAAPASSKDCRWGSFDAKHAPGECWRPFSETSPFNRVLPPNPRQTLDSLLVAQMVAGLKPGLRFEVGNADTPDDYDHPIYFSRRSDPRYEVDCTDFGGQCPIDGLRVRIPRAARPAAGGDGHLAVIDQRRGVEYDFWRARKGRVRHGRGRLTAGWGGRTAIGTADAQGLDAAATASGFALSAGVIRAAELRAGEIDHALFMTVYCTNGQSVSPAVDNPGRSCSEVGRPEITGPAMGQHFFLEMSEGEIRGLGLPAWQQTILLAMARYGVFVGDTGGPDSWGIKIESGSSFTSFGRPDPWVRLAKRLGLPSYTAEDGTTRYTLDMREAVDWGGELRVAAPCVSAGRC